MWSQIFDGGTFRSRFDDVPDGFRREAFASDLFLSAYSPKDCTLIYLIDLCINNAIMGAREGNTYAQTEGERRSVRRPAQASFGIAGFRPLSERSGSAHPMPCQFGDA